MKRIKQTERMVRTERTAEPAAQRQGARGELQIAELAQVVGGDVYMQNPRGSNDSHGSGG